MRTTRAFLKAPACVVLRRARAAWTECLGGVFQGSVRHSDVRKYVLTFDIEHMKKVLRPSVDL